MFQMFQARESKRIPSHLKGPQVRLILFKLFFVHNLLGMCIWDVHTHYKKCFLSLCLFLNPQEVERSQNKTEI